MTKREVTNINKNYKGKTYPVSDHSLILTVVWIPPLLEQELELAAVVAWFKTRKEKIKAIN